MNATLSLLGLYNYDNSLFDGLVVPASVNKQTVIDNLLAETAELESLYSDFDALKLMIGYYAQRQLSVWERVAAVCSESYDPLYNTDRNETETETETRDLAGSASSSGSGSSTNSTAAFNSTSLQTADKTDNSASQSTNTTDTGTVTHTRTHHAYGNIGVTTSQEMLRQEIEVAGIANAVDYIIHDLRNRFCVLVY